MDAGRIICVYNMYSTIYIYKEDTFFSPPPFRPREYIIYIYIDNNSKSYTSRMLHRCTYTFMYILHNKLSENPLQRRLLCVVEPQTTDYSANSNHRNLPEIFFRFKPTFYILLFIAHRSYNTVLLNLYVYSVLGVYNIIL